MGVNSAAARPLASDCVLFQVICVKHLITFHVYSELALTTSFGGESRLRWFPAPPVTKCECCPVNNDGHSGHFFIFCGREKPTVEVSHSVSFQRTYKWIMVCRCLSHKLAVVNMCEPSCESGPCCTVYCTYCRPCPCFSLRADDLRSSLPLLHPPSECPLPLPLY